MRHARVVNRRSPDGVSDGEPPLRWDRPPTRGVVRWLLGLMLSMLVLFMSVGVLLWNTFHEPRSPAVMSLGVTLLAVSAPAVAVTGFGTWLARRNQRRRPRE